MGKTLLTIGMTVLSLSIPTGHADARFHQLHGARPAAHQVAKRLGTAFSPTSRRLGIGAGIRRRINGENRVHN
jgi:hypothetical protein